MKTRILLFFLSTVAAGVQGQSDSDVALKEIRLTVIAGGESREKKMLVRDGRAIETILKDKYGFQTEVVFQKLPTEPRSGSFGSDDPASDFVFVAEAN